MGVQQSRSLGRHRERFAKLFKNGEDFDLNFDTLPPAASKSMWGSGVCDASGISPDGDPLGPAGPATGRHGPGTKWGPAPQLALRGGGQGPAGPVWTGTGPEGHQRWSGNSLTGIRSAQQVRHRTGTGPGPSGVPPRSSRCGGWLAFPPPNPLYSPPLYVSLRPQTLSWSMRFPCQEVRRSDVSGVVLQKASGCPPIKPSYPS